MSLVGVNFPSPISSRLYFSFHLLHNRELVNRQVLLLAEILLTKTSTLLLLCFCYTDNNYFNNYVDVEDECFLCCCLYWARCLHFFSGRHICVPRRYTEIHFPFSKVGKGVFREPWMPILNCRESWKNVIISRDPWTKVLRDSWNN